MVAMVDTAIYTNLVIYIEKNTLFLNLSLHTVWTVELSYYVPSMYCAFDDDRTIIIAMVDIAISANLIFYMENNYFLALSQILAEGICYRRVRPSVCP